MLSCDFKLITMYISDCCQFCDIRISQGSVATYFRCGGIFKYEFVANLPLSLPVKEFWKSVNIWGSYGQEFGVLFFLRHSVYETVARPSVRLSVRVSVCLSHIIRPPHAHAAGSLLWGRRAEDIDRLLHDRRAAATASSVTLSAGVGSWTQTCLFLSKRR